MRAQQHSQPLALLIVSLAATPAAADVITVDATGGADFTTIDPAISAAAEGDTILVRQGNYLAFLVIDKGLEIIGDGQVTISAGPRVANLSAGKSVLIQNMLVIGVASETHFAGHGINLINNAGQVRIENCILLAASNLVEPPDCQGFSQNEGWNGARIESCADVVISDSSIHGGVGVIQNSDLQRAEPCGFKTEGGQGGYGVYALLSNVGLYRSVVTGGNGGMGGEGGHAGDGYRAVGGTLFASGTSFTGGTGATGFDWAFGPGGNGGHGISGTPAFSARLFASSAAGGTGGWGIVGPEGAPGLPTSGGTYLDEAGTARIFDVDSPVRVGEPLLLEFLGEPFDAVFLLVSGVDAFLPLPEYHGMLLCFPAASLSLGFLDAQGELALPLTLAPLAGNPDSLTFVLQSFHVSTSFDLVIGSAAHLVALDPAF